jgi:ABC-2 type transport system ATP-binding protein
MIEVDQLVKRFAAVTAVDGVSFTVRPGHVTGFLGPNGAGKPVTELRHSLLARQADCRSP